MEAGVVQLELLQGVAEVLVVVGVGGVEAREDHGPGLLVARQELLRPVVGVQDRVADPRVGHLADRRGQVSHFPGAQLLLGHAPEAHEADLVHLVGGVHRPEGDPHPRPQDAVHDPDAGDGAEVLVVVGVEDQGAEGRLGIAGGRGDPSHHRLEDLGDAGAFLGRGQEYVPGLDPQEIDQLLPVLLGLGPREIDLVEDRDDLQVRVQRQEEVGEGLGLDPLGGVHHQDRPLAGRQGPGHLVGEVHVTRRVDQVQLVGRAVLGPVVHADRVELDRDPPLPLELVGVQDLLPHLPPVEGARPLQQPVGEGGLAVVDVGDDAEVADMIQAHGAGSRNSQWGRGRAALRCRRGRPGATLQTA